MKNIFYTAALALIMLSQACDPIEDRAALGDGLSDASALDVSLGKLYGEDGYLNKIQVRCTSPVTCQWTDGFNPIEMNSGEFTFLFSGEQKLTLKAYSNGNVLEKTVTVDGVIAPPPPSEYGYLFGYKDNIEKAVKTWVWNTTDGWPAPDGGPAGPLIMSGGSPSGSRDYWGWTPDDMSSECASKGYPDEGLGSKMVFSLQGKKVTKYDPTGKVIGEGSISFNMTPTSIYGSLGTLTFISTNILFPYDRNGITPWSFNTFTITYLDDDHLMLFTPSSNGGWYYVFNAE